MKDHADFENWLRKQTKDLPEPDVSPEFLAAQRRSIYQRLEARTGVPSALRWGLSFAMLLLLVAGGVTMERRHSNASQISDEQLFSDLSAMDQSNEPKAIQPIHGLFQE